MTKKKRLPKLWERAMKNSGLGHLQPHLRTIAYGGETNADGKLWIWRYDGVRKESLNMYLDVVNHSPDGGNWGYGGSGPAQLALAILMDFFNEKDKAKAIRLHQHFKGEVIARLQQEMPWSLTRDEVAATVAKIEHGSI